MSDGIFTFHYSGSNNQRLDKFLVEQFPEMSRSRLQGLIRDGFVTIDHIPAVKTGQDLHSGQLVRVVIPPIQSTELIPETIPLDVIFENQDLMVVNKPAGMVVHPAAGHFSGTLVHAALAHAPELEGIGGEQRPGVVHRLDKDTSGLILLAKNDRTHRRLQDQFRLRQVEKSYLALVDGHPPTPEGRIEAPIGRDPSHRKEMAIVPLQKGRQAVSEYHTIQSFSQHTLLDVHPLTGRTHQIRLHLAFLGCPIVGDNLYGRKRRTLPIKRQFLHAAKLVITLPNESKPRTFEAPLPDDLREVLNDLSK